jgi:transcription initiation factor TFIIF subunit beta
VRVEDAGLDQAEQNRLSGGYHNTKSNLGRGMVVSHPSSMPPFARPELIAQAIKKAKQTGDKRARLEKHELLDRLFSMFSDKPYWSISAMKNTLEQPEQHLREVLKEIAEMEPEGQYRHLWRLKEEWGTQLQESKAKGTKLEYDGVDGEENGDAGGSDTEDDDDEDMEEVM